MSASSKCLRNSLGSCQKCFWHFPHKLANVLFWEDASLFLTELLYLLGGPGSYIHGISKVFVWLLTDVNHQCPLGHGSKGIFYQKGCFWLKIPLLPYPKAHWWLTSVRSTNKNLTNSVYTGAQATQQIW